jgi:ABC-type polysaccharide/polyol phosphate transport system ATPase subunit
VFNRPARALDDDVVIQLENILVRYRVPHERYATLKEHTIRLLQRRVQYDDFLALNNVSLRVRRGEVVGIIGRNGAGKSTLLKVIGRVLRPTRGRVMVRGRIAPLLEFGAGFHPELTGRENIFLNGAILGFSRAEMQAKFDRIVDFAELREFIDAPLRTYSSGMIARLGFAVATDIEPDVLIIDEVLSVGDAAFQQKSAERIQSFRASGTTILLVSHNLALVEAMCDRAIWLDRGRIVAEGNAASVGRKYRGDDTRAEAKRLAESAGPSLNQRWGTGLIEIVAVRLKNGNGEATTIFETGDTLVLEMDYLAHAPIPSPIFGMAIHRHDGVHITGPNTAFAGLTLPTVEGRGTVTYTVPYLPLLEGLYHISVAVLNYNDTEMFDYHDRCYPFRVIANGRVRERYGMMTLQGEWKYQPADSYASSRNRSDQSV